MNYTAYDDRILYLIILIKNIMSTLNDSTIKSVQKIQVFYFAYSTYMLWYEKGKVCVGTSHAIKY